MDTEGGGPGWKEAVAGVEEEDGVLPRDRGEEAVQERRDARPLGAGDQVGMAKRQPAEEGVERRQSGRQHVGVRGEIRGAADRERWRQCGKGRG